MIRTRLLGVVTLGSLLLAACGDDGANAPVSVLDAGSGDDAGEPNATTSETSSIANTEQGADASVSSETSDTTTVSDMTETTAVNSLDASPTSEATTNDATASGDASLAPTFYEHILPLLEENCLGCHVEGGIGPVGLDSYAAAKTYAAAIQAATESRVMPPYLVNNDGSCGDFENTKYLSDAELQTIKDWVAGGTLEGTPRDVVVPLSAELPDTYQVSTPHFSPVAGGGALDAHDDYRCFLIEPPAIGKFITGYQVLPGNSAIVHHVVVNLVDLDGASDYPATDAGVVTNRQVIEGLDALDPDVEGWRCYGLAGDGVAVDSVPTVWAPGQGTVTYPNEAGIPITPSQKLVVQIHYNLADEAHHGESDETRIRFDLAEPQDVPNVAVYLPTDPMLNALLRGEEPTLLPAGEASTKYIWERSFEQMGLGGIPQFQLWGLFPHMHETGRKFTVELVPAGAEPDAGAQPNRCEAQIDRWDFHWQHLYFLREGQVLTPEDSLRVTCDYDTTGRSEPISPGWGTENEMCFLGVFVTVPNQF